MFVRVTEPLAAPDGTTRDQLGCRKLARRGLIGIAAARPTTTAGVPRPWPATRRQAAGRAAPSSPTRQATRVPSRGPAHCRIGFIDSAMAPRRASGMAAQCRERVSSRMNAASRSSRSAASMAMPAARAMPDAGGSPGPGWFNRKESGRKRPVDDGDRSGFGHRRQSQSPVPATVKVQSSKTRDPQAAEVGGPRSGRRRAEEPSRGDARCGLGRGGRRDRGTRARQALDQEAAAQA
jgi:hypothetical protein